MDLNNAIAAHAAWKTKLRAAINRKETLDVATISVDNKCELGQWLHGAGKMQHVGCPEFSTLVQRHREFHTEAGKVAGLINTQKFEQAEKAIEANSAFSNASTAVGIAINSLRKVAA